MVLPARVGDSAHGCRDCVSTLLRPCVIASGFARLLRYFYQVSLNASACRRAFANICFGYFSSASNVAVRKNI